MTSVQQNLPSSGVRRSRNTAPPGIPPDLALRLPRQPLPAALLSTQNLPERLTLLWLPQPALQSSACTEFGEEPKIESGFYFWISFKGSAAGPSATGRLRGSPEKLEACSWMLLWRDAPVAAPLRSGLPDQHDPRTNGRGRRRRPSRPGGRIGANTRDQNVPDLNTPNQNAPVPHEIEIFTASGSVCASSPFRPAPASTGSVSAGPHHLIRRRLPASALTQRPLLVGA